MMHYFVLNPASGNKKGKNDILREIRDAAEKVGVEYDVRFTKAPKDGRKIVRSICENADGPVRIYGCGGDGTVNELVNGAYGFDNVEIGVIPQGTGNDYIRNYGDPEQFLDVEKQLLGKSQDSDLIHYKAEYNGEITEGFCANMFNIGFDCNVVDMTNTVKTWPLFNGSTAYLASVFIVLAKKKETNLRIEYADGTVRDGNILLCSVANGCFCGGGIKGVPKSILDDGLMDVSVVRGGITRTTFVKLFPKYQKGTHLEDPLLVRKKICDYRKEKTLTITSNDESLRLCVDGEISSQKRVEFTVLQDAFRFIVPEGV